MGSARWSTSLDISPERVELLVTERGQEVETVMQARLCGCPAHPRALSFLLEGLALWSGTRLCVVIYADKAVHPLLGLGRVGDEWPDETPLVEYLLVEHPRRSRGWKGVS